MLWGVGTDRSKHKSNRNGSRGGKDVMNGQAKKNKLGNGAHAGEFPI